MMDGKLYRLKEKLIDNLDLPMDVALGIPKITIIGKKEISIENHKGILKFEEDELRVSTSLGVIQIRGENFEIVFVGGTTITIRGIFISVGYETYE